MSNRTDASSLSWIFLFIAVINPLLLSTLLLTWFQSSLANVSIDKKEATRILFPNVFSRIILRMTHDKPRHKMQWFLEYIFQSFILANVGMTSTAIRAISSLNEFSQYLFKVLSMVLVNIFNYWILVLECIEAIT